MLKIVPDPPPTASLLSLRTVLLRHPHKPALRCRYPGSGTVLKTHRHLQRKGRQAPAFV